MRGTRAKGMETDSKNEQGQQACATLDSTGSREQKIQHAAASRIRGSEILAIIGLALKLAIAFAPHLILTSKNACQHDTEALAGAQ